MGRELSSLQEESLEVTHTVPLRILKTLNTDVPSPEADVPGPGEH